MKAQLVDLDTGVVTLVKQEFNQDQYLQLMYELEGKGRKVEPIEAAQPQQEEEKPFVRHGNGLFEEACARMDAKANPDIMYMAHHVPLMNLIKPFL